MWQEALRRRHYFLERTEDVVTRQEQQKSRDWLYESYYCMSQQHPLIIFLLLIVMGACLALLAVFFASGLEYWNRKPKSSLPVPVRMCEQTCQLTHAQRDT